MAAKKKVEDNAGDQKAPAFITIVRIKRKDKSIIEKGVDVSGLDSETLADWEKRGMIEAKK